MFIFNKSKSEIYHMFYFFILYSFIGRLLETTYLSITNGYFVIRGNPYSPLSPIYGFGSLIIIELLTSIKDNPSLLFLFSSAITTALEFFTGLIMRLGFNIYAWDYSDQPFNLLGIVCARNLLIWGLLSMLMIYKIHPIAVKMINAISIPIKRAIFSCIILYFFIYISIVVD